jgi:hypothetical protein
MWQKILEDFSTYPTFVFIFLIPACMLGIYHWKRLPQIYQWFVAFLWFDLSIETGSRVWRYIIDKHNNLPLLHLYTLGELVIWLFIYRLLIGAGYLQKYFWWILGVLSVLVVSNTIWLQPLHTYNSYAKTLVQLVIILLGLQYEFSFVDSDPAQRTDKSLLWVNRGVLLYYAGTLFIFMFSQYAVATWQQGYQQLWHFNLILNIMLHLNILIALWKTTRKYQASPT